MSARLAPTLFERRMRACQRRSSVMGVWKAPQEFMDGATIRIGPTGWNVVRPSGFDVVAHYAPPAAASPVAWAAAAPTGLAAAGSAGAVARPSWRRTI